jgi:hypothetical protein
MSLLELTQKHLEVKATEPGHDGDEHTVVTAYLNHASMVMNEMKTLPYFKNRIKDRNKVNNIITDIDNMFYLITHKAINGGKK